MMSSRVKRFKPDPRMAPRFVAGRWGFRGKVAAVLGTGVLAASVAACGSGTAGGGSSGTSQANNLSAAQVAAAKSVANTAESVPSVYSFKSFVTALSAHPFTSADRKKLASSTMWVISVGNTDAFAVQLNQAVASGAAPLGIKVKYLDGQQSTQTQSADVKEAVAQHASAIILNLVNVDAIGPAVAAAGKAGIPVIDLADIPETAPLPPGDTQHIDVDLVSGGTPVAAFAVAGSAKGTHPTILLLTDNEFSSMVTRVTSMKAGLDRLCGSSCTVLTYNIPVSSLGPSATSTIATELRTHPDVSWILPVYDAMATDAVAAVEDVHKTQSIHVVSFDGNAPNLTDVANNHVEMADEAEAGTWFGWAAVDAAGRAILDLPKVQEPIPVRLLTGKVVNAGTSQVQLFGTSFEALYRKVWGLG